MIIVLNGNGNNYNYKNYKNKDCDIFVLQSEQFKNSVPFVKIDMQCL